MQKQILSYTTSAGGAATVTGKNGNVLNFSPAMSGGDEPLKRSTHINKTTSYPKFVYVSTLLARIGDS